MFVIDVEIIVQLLAKLNKIMKTRLRFERISVKFNKLKEEAAMPHVNAQDITPHRTTPHPPPTPANLNVQCKLLRLSTYCTLYTI